MKQKLSSNRIFSLITYSLLLITCLSGCGYTVGSSLPSSMKYIYVEPFKNNINISQDIDFARYQVYRPMLETDVTKAVINQFISDGNLKIASSKEAANVILIASLIGFEQQPMQYSDDEQSVTQYRLNIIVDMKLTDKKKVVVWEESYFVGDSIYNVEGPDATSEDAALTVAIDDLAKRVVERVIDNW